MGKGIVIRLLETSIDVFPIWNTLTVNAIRKLIRKGKEQDNYMKSLALSQVNM